MILTFGFHCPNRIAYPSMGHHEIPPHGYGVSLMNVPKDLLKNKFLQYRYNLNTEIQIHSKTGLLVAFYLFGPSKNQTGF